MEDSTGDVIDIESTGDDDCEPLILELSVPDTHELVEVTVRLLDESCDPVTEVDDSTRDVIDIEDIDDDCEPLLVDNGP